MQTFCGNNGICIFQTRVEPEPAFRGSTQAFYCDLSDENQFFNKWKLIFVRKAFFQYDKFKIACNISFPQRMVPAYNIDLSFFNHFLNHLSQKNIYALLYPETEKKGNPVYIVIRYF